MAAGGFSGSTKLLLDLLANLKNGQTLTSELEKELLKHIYVELKKQNKHLELITSEEIDDADILDEELDNG